MKALSDMYEKQSTSNKIHRMRQLFNLLMTGDALKLLSCDRWNGVVTTLLDKFNSVTTLLEIEFDDEVHALILLSCDRWNVVATAMSSSSRSKKLSLMTFVIWFSVKRPDEIRRRESDESSTSLVL